MRANHFKQLIKQSMPAAINSGSSKLAGGFAVSALALALSACGGSSSSGSSSATVDMAQLQGSVFASSVAGATVSVVDASGNVLAGPVQSDASGAFLLDIDSALLNADITLKAMGGQFVDEATGELTQAGEMLLLLAAGEAEEGSRYTLTPESTIVAAMVRERGMSLADARAAFLSTFGYLPNPEVQPVDATTASTASEEQLKAGLRAAVFSQLTKQMGLGAHEQFALLAALAEDLGDGRLDGKSDALPVSLNLSDRTDSLSPHIHSDYVTALLAFKGGMKNKTGLNNTQIGLVPLATMAATESYDVTYSKLDMSRQGRSQFALTINDKMGMPVDGVTPQLNPVMNMAMHSHGTPFEGCTETDAQGTSICTLYYLMASEMMNGASMGYWNIGVQIGEETVSFTPSVMMAMGDTARAVLKGVNDMIPVMSMPVTDSGMAGDMSGHDMPGHDMSGHSMSAMAMAADMEARSYYLFNDGLIASTEGHQFALFIASKNSMNDYPAVATGSSLKKGDMTVSVDEVLVEVSIDGNTFTTASELGGGHFRVDALMGLVTGTETEVYVRLTVNGEQKTSDGMMLGDANGLATFFVTP
ncbi:MAG: hypothetical protein H7A01_08060 [Hahellaceae bacterium]|nr:hypothetical protein [Hahellaceae bacterium]MCP5211578.1 hypothetical protein [Hahellaceae bacterium]